MDTKHRKTLNSKQLQILYALYKFRFGTEELLSQDSGNSRRYTHERVKLLVDQEYIGRRYETRYKLAGRAAEYYLLPRGIGVLKQRPADFKQQVLRKIRKDVNASDRFARHSINIFATYTKLKELYGEASGNGFHFYTKTYMIGDKAEEFPKPLPDAFASFRTTQNLRLKNFLIECFDDTMPQSAMRKRIEQLIDHADSDEWTLTKDYPDILLVCKTERLQNNVTRWAKQESEQSWQIDLTILALTIDELRNLER